MWYGVVSEAESSGGAPRKPSAPQAPSARAQARAHHSLLQNTSLPLSAIPGSPACVTLRRPSLLCPPRCTTRVPLCLRRPDDLRPFFAKNPKGSYNGPAPNATFIEGHAVLLVGYDNTRSERAGDANSPAHASAPARPCICHSPRAALRCAAPWCRVWGPDCNHTRASPTLR